jgi:hypothetical protein
LVGACHQRLEGVFLAPPLNLLHFEGQHDSEERNSVAEVGSNPIVSEKGAKRKLQSPCSRRTTGIPFCINVLEDYIPKKVGEGRPGCSSIVLRYHSIIYSHSCHETVLWLTVCKHQYGRAVFVLPSERSIISRSGIERTGSTDCTGWAICRYVYRLEKPRSGTKRYGPKWWWGWGCKLVCCAWQRVICSGCE